MRFLINVFWSSLIIHKRSKEKKNKKRFSKRSSVFRSRKSSDGGRQQQWNKRAAPNEKTNLWAVQEAMLLKCKFAYVSLQATPSDNTGLVRINRKSGLTIHRLSDLEIVRRKRVEPPEMTAEQTKKAKCRLLCVGKTIAWRPQTGS